MTSEPRVSIIIINYNNWENTVECLESLKDIKYENYEIIVIDNGSTNNSYHEIKCRYSSLKIFKLNNNLGFSSGVNFGISKAQNYEYLLLLNNDVTVDKLFLTKLVFGIQLDKNIGLIGSKIYYSQSKKIWSAGIGMRRITKATYLYAFNDNNKLWKSRGLEVDYLTGCCLLIRKDVIDKVGLFDEEYFMYYEDIDFCMRAKEKFFKIVYFPSSIVWHKGGGASNKVFIDYYRMRNHFIFLKKRFHYKNSYILIICFYIFVERMLRAIVRKFLLGDQENLVRRIKSIWIGFSSGLRYIYEVNP
ncbi:MAG: glycosyltransferase family 2 protein [Candidatus Thermoplasmatota archaeon]|nr:glycosyltransferase family 2 protein [Candidatus Thermoplasmatota archaeon]